MVVRKKVSSPSVGPQNFNIGFSSESQQILGRNYHISNTLNHFCRARIINPVQLVDTQTNLSLSN